MNISLCLYKHAANPNSLIFESSLLRWRSYNKGAIRKSGTTQKYNALTAELVISKDVDDLSEMLNALINQFELNGGVREFLYRAGASENWIRIEINVKSDELRDVSFSRKEINQLSDLGLGLEFWFIKE